MRHFQLRRVDNPDTGAVRVRVTGLTIASDETIYLEPYGYGGYRVMARTSSGPMALSQLETALEYVRVALAEYGLGGFGRPAAQWSDILAACRGAY